LFCPLPTRFAPFSFVPFPSTFSSPSTASTFLNHHSSVASSILTCAVLHRPRCMKGTPNARFLCWFVLKYLKSWWEGLCSCCSLGKSELRVGVWERSAASYFDPRSVDAEGNIIRSFIISPHTKENWSTGYVVFLRYGFMRWYWWCTLTALLGLWFTTDRFIINEVIWGSSTFKSSQSLLALAYRIILACSFCSTFFS
jgi:hypothetical protein